MEQHLTSSNETSIKMFKGETGSVEPRKLFTSKDLVVTAATSLLYLGVSRLLIGFKWDQVVLVLLFNVLYYLSFRTRQFIVGFSIFIVYWILYDYMKAFPNYQYNTVHLGSLYEAERALFGLNYGGLVFTPNEYWQIHSSKELDLIAGFFYLCWVPVPLLFAGYLFYKNRELFLQFSMTFLLVNLLGFVVYYIYPAAPPWYIQEHGLRFISNTPGSAAGLQRFDHLLGLSIFQSLYVKNSNVFAAMPSLHASYMLVVVYYGVRNAMGATNLLFAVLMFGIWFSAVYTSHHYVIDVLAGGLCGVCGIFLYQKVLLRLHIITVLQKQLLLE